MICLMTKKTDFFCCCVKFAGVDFNLHREGGGMERQCDVSVS